MKATQIFRPYQLHRDQIPIVRKYNLVCVGSPATEGSALTDGASCFKSAFTLSRGKNRFAFSSPSRYGGDEVRFSYFCPLAEAKKLGLDWQYVPRTAPRKSPSAKRIEALEAENKALRETLAKINKLSAPWTQALFSLPK